MHPARLATHARQVVRTIAPKSYHAAAAQFAQSHNVSKAVALRAILTAAIHEASTEAKDSGNAKLDKLLEAIPLADFNSAHKARLAQLFYQDQNGWTSYDKLVRRASTPEALDALLTELPSPWEGDLLRVLTDPLSKESERWITAHHAGHTAPARVKRFILRVWTHVRHLKPEHGAACARLLIHAVEKLNYRASLFTELRKELMARRGDAPYKALRASFTAGLKDFNERRQQQEEVVLKRAPIRVNAEQYVQLCKDLLIHHDPLYRAAGLIMVSGNRKMEIIKYSTFDGEDCPSDRFVRVRGLLKKRATAHPPVIKPLLAGVTRQRFLRILDGVRTAVRPMIIGSVLNTKATRTLSEVYRYTGYTAQQARAVYARLSYEEFADPKAMTLQTWTTKVLGHTSVTMTVHYAPPTLVGEKRKVHPVPAGYVKLAEGVVVKKLRPASKGMTVAQRFQRAIDLFNEHGFMFESSHHLRLLGMSSKVSDAVYAKLLPIYTDWVLADCPPPKLFLQKYSPR